MENKIDIKKEWEAPSLEELKLTRTLGGDIDDTESNDGEPSDLGGLGSGG